MVMRCYLFNDFITIYLSKHYKKSPDAISGLFYVVFINLKEAKCNWITIREHLCIALRK